MWWFIIVEYVTYILLCRWWCDADIILLLSFVYFLLYQMVMWQHSATHTFQFLFQFILWNILCWWCNLLLHSAIYMVIWLHSARSDLIHTIRSHLSLNKIKLGHLKLTQTNPTHLKTHPRVLRTLSNILGVFNNCFCHLKRARGPVSGGRGGGPSRDSVGGILPLTTSSCGEMTGWPWKLGWQSSILSTGQSFGRIRALEHKHS